MRALALERVVLDGEVVAFDEQGRPSFQRLGRRMHLTRPHDVAHAASEVPVVYVAFDVLQVEGRDVRKLPLSARKELLSKIAPRRGIIRLLDHLEGDGRPLSELCDAMGLEGLVAKTLSSPYRPGPERSADWVKIKRPRDEDFVVTAWVEGNGGRKSFGAIEVSSYQDGQLRLRSRVGSGFDGAMIQKIIGLLAPLEVEQPTSVGDPIRGGGKRHHTKAEIVVSVSFGGWTEDAGLRHPVFHGLRPDIAPDACTAAPPSVTEDEERDIAPEPPPEAAPPTKAAAPANAVPEARRTKVKVSNLTKVFWPDEGYTKGELIDYYRAIAPAILPFLRDRPIVLVRYPDGIKGKSFYQWNVPEGTPTWMRTLHLLDDEGQSRKHTFIVDDIDGLTHIANLGCIPIHVLPYRSASVTECDYFVVDFDIGPRSFSDAVTLAFSLREILTELGLVGFPKTSGQSGLHVLVPLGPGISFDVAKVMCDLVGRVLQARHPELATMGRRIEGRGDRVFVDVGQTGRSRTIVAPYSVRAHPGATVSMPLRWEDVHRALDPREFSMFSAPLRVAERGAAFEGFFEARPDVAAVVEKLGQKLGVEG
jgi:bifunctional non-homologous end joining protein LigD